MYISELHSYHRLLLLKFTRNPVHFFTHINCYMSIYAKKVSGTAYHSLRKKSFSVLSMAGLKLPDFPLFKLYEIWWVSFLLWQSVCLQTVFLDNQSVVGFGHTLNGEDFCLFFCLFWMCEHYTTQLCILFCIYFLLINGI